MMWSIARMMAFSLTARRARARRDWTRVAIGRSWARPCGALGREPGLLALAGVIAMLDSVLSVVRYVHFLAAYDLAIFDQVVWHYSRFEAPFSSIKGENLLGDHFHPLVAVLAPLYWVWSDPRMLLIAQSVLVAASIIPVFLFAAPRVGRAGAYLLAGAYGVFWGLQVGVLFDFHEVAFAPLLIALAILLADRRRWGWFWLVTALLLLVKEDLSIFVAFFGIYLLTRREIRHGVALVVVGIAWYELTTGVLIFHLAGGTPYAYWTYGELGKNAPDAIWALIQAPWRVFTIGFSPGHKAELILGLLVPFVFLSLCSRLFILALPLLAERVLSTNPNLWSGKFHYSLSVAPVLAMGAACGLAHLARLLPERRRRKVTIGATGAMLVVSLALTIVLGIRQELGAGGHSFYSEPSFAPAAYRALRQVPAAASLATADLVLPHASERQHLQLMDAKNIGKDQYLLVDVLAPECCGASGNASFNAFGTVLDGELPTVTPVYYDQGWLVARRPPNGQRASSGVLVPMPAPTGRRVDKLWLRWHAEIAVASGRLYGCLAMWAKRNPSSTACFASANAPFEGAQATLAAAIHAAQPAMHEDCAQLAGAALRDSHRLALDFLRLTTAGTSRDRAGLAPALTAEAVDERDQDLSGQLDRFVILCSPRSSAAS
ncbi:MAG: DUF2079 domain-containing protein [Actinomycetota bacterium]|nr:DUF2079 domain-containing protein [Actinomycetota bacterium]